MLCQSTSDSEGETEMEIDIVDSHAEEATAEDAVIEVGVEVDSGTTKTITETTDVVATWAITTETVTAEEMTGTGEEVTEEISAVEAPETDGVIKATMVVTRAGAIKEVVGEAKVAGEAKPVVGETNLVVGAAIRAAAGVINKQDGAISRATAVGVTKATTTMATGTRTPPVGPTITTNNRISRAGEEVAVEAAMEVVDTVDTTNKQKTVVWIATRTVHFLEILQVLLEEVLVY